MFPFEKCDKNIQFNSLFLGNSENIYLYLQLQVAYLSEDWKKLSVRSSALFMVLALEMRGREA